MKLPRPLLIFVLLAGFCGPLQAGGARCVLQLEPEIDCPSCEDRLKHLLETARGVQSAEVDELSNNLVVRYDAARINVKALIGRLAVTGYKAKEVR
jgi:copper chaperone CopZ